MSPAAQPPNPSPADLRRSWRMQLFLAGRMSARIGEDPGDREPPIPGLRHFPGPNVDIGVALGEQPAQREMLAWARFRQLTVMVAQVPRSEAGTLTIDTYLWDVGVVILNRFHLFTPNDGTWWLVGKGVEVISLKLTHEGPVPTLTRPYRDEAQLAQGLAAAESELRAFWRAV